VDVHHFKLLDKLREIALAPQDYGNGPEWVTDYNRCIGCHICAEVCPTSYINMGLGAPGHYDFDLS
jgi:ferredoxin